MFLLEVYVSRSSADEARRAGRRARTAAEALARDRHVVIRYVRTTFLPDDETCFHLFEADSAELVEEVGRRAELGTVRVVGAIEDSLPPEPDAR